MSAAFGASIACADSGSAQALRDSAEPGPLALPFALPER
jgi:hypothetical protein